LLKLTDKNDILNGLANAVVNGDKDKAIKFAQKALKENIDPYEAITDGCTHGMHIVSEKYDNGEMFIPHIMLSSEAMNEAITVLQPHVDVEKTKESGVAVVGVILGDIHDIGINLVSSLLKSAGITVYDLGKDVPYEDFIEIAKDVNANVIGLSAMMTTSMMGMKDVVKMARREIPDVKIMIGGGPVSRDFCGEIGADAYADDARDAIEIVKEIIKEDRRKKASV
jgi:corrinoid protein of di/trimethylamine methyltransferase